MREYILASWYCDKLVETYGLPKEITEEKLFDTLEVIYGMGINFAVEQQKGVIYLSKTDFKQR